MTTLRAWVSTRRFDAFASAGVFVLSSVIVLYLTLVTSGSIVERKEAFRLRRFFTAQAEAIVSGRLWINHDDGFDECFFADGQCYGYFGVVPSLLRIPLLPFAGGDGMTDAFVVIALLAGIAGSLVLVNVVFSAIVRERESRWSRIAFVSALLIAGPGNLWIQLTLPTGYEEAIIWASTFATWGLVALVLWWKTGANRWLGLATVAFILGANSRPSVVPISVAAAFILALYVIVRWKTSPNARALAWAGSMAVLPVASTVGVWFAKLGTFLPPLAVNESVMESERWAKIMEVNGGHDSWWGFIPTNLLQYLRPDSLTWVNGQLMAIRPKFSGIPMLPPLDGTGIFVTPMASVTALVPAVLVLIAISLWATPRIVSELPGHPLLPKIVSIGIALVGWSALALLVINVGVQNRYMGDLAPAIALTAAFGAGALANGDRVSLPVRRALIILIAILAVAGIGIEVLHQHWQISRYL